MNENTDDKIYAKAAFIAYIHNIDLDAFRDIASYLEYDLKNNFLYGEKRLEELLSEVNELIYRFEQLQLNDLKLCIEFSG